jgi:hypothetical protein
MGEGAIEAGIETSEVFTDQNQATILVCHMRMIKNNLNKLIMSVHRPHQNHV